MSEAVIYGVQPVREALRAGQKIRAIYLARGNAGATRQLVEEARSKNVRVFEAARSEIEQRAGTSQHQGVVAVLDAEEAGIFAELEDVLAMAEEAGEPPLVVVLDGIQDPRNLGALIRSAYALGAHGVVIPTQRAAPVTAATVKTSAGATAHLPIVRMNNVKHAIEQLKEAGVWSAAATIDGDPAEDVRLDGPMALVIGSEDKGVRPTLAAACDHRVRIDLARPFDSLNAAVAGGILLYEVRRQRRAAGQT